MTTLFDIPETKEETKLTCNTCEHRERWQCNSVIVQYCGIRKSNSTNNGLLKIKCKTKACIGYTPIKIQENIVVLKTIQK